MNAKLPRIPQTLTYKQTHTHRFAQIFLLGLNIDFDLFVQPNPNTHPNPNEFMP